MICANQKFRKRLSLVAVTILSGLMFVASNALAQESPRSGGTITIGLHRAPIRYDPHIYDGGTHAVFQGNLYNGLLRFTPSGEVVPDIAESWRLIDDTTLEFTLRQNVVFHDGSPLTADDVVFSFERLLNPDTGATQRATISAAVAEVEKVDDFTVRLHLNDPTASILELLARPEVAMVSRAFVDSGGDYTTQVMGTGPFRLTQIEPDVRYVLSKNDAYYKEGLPYLDEMRLVPIVDDGARINALYTNEVDFIQYVPSQQMELLEAHPELQYWSGDATYMALFLNQNRPPFDDVRVRQAFAYAIDRQGVIEAAYDGRGTPITGGLLPAGTWGHNEDLEGTYSFDPERARSLLAEAGYADGLDVTILAASIAVHLRPAEVVQAQLQQSGINVRLDVTEVAVMSGRRVEGDYDILIYGASPQLNDPDLYTSYFLTGAPAMFAAPTGFSDSLLDSYLLEGRSTFDVEVRKEIYHSFEQRLLELSPMAFINWREQGFAAQPHVRGFQMIAGVAGLLSEIAFEQVWVNR